MKKPETPKPGSAAYDVEKTQDLNTPKYHSSTDRRSSHELPATENMNDQPEDRTDHKDLPKTDLGNKRSEDEEQREKIINR